MPAPWTTASVLAALAFALSAALTYASIGYARHRRLIDLPGQRRSHAAPTPRGGGVAIVVAVLLCVGVPIALWSPDRWPVVLAIVLVAAVGWIDDHRPLAAGVRFAVHWLAALVVFAPTLLQFLAAPGAAMEAFSGSFGAILAAYLVAGLVVGLAIVWSINLHNFMDGIDGLLAVQAIFVFAVLAVLLDRHGAPEAAAAAVVMAAAVAGFVPFNFPHARIFMGDVGSGVLGLLIALVGFALLGQGTAALASVLIACSAFVVDATATLLSRMLRGRRWYSAHREHLYQWLVRAGRSHAQVVGLYTGWNLLVVVPVLFWINRLPNIPSSAPEFASATAPLASGPALLALGGVYGLGATLWWAGKRGCLRQVRQRGRR